KDSSQPLMWLGGAHLGRIGAVTSEIAPFHQRSAIIKEKHWRLLTAAPIKWRGGGRWNASVGIPGHIGALWVLARVGRSIVASIHLKRCAPVNVAISACRVARRKIHTL